MPTKSDFGWKIVEPDEVVPHSDSPLTGVRGLCLRFLSEEIWPQEIRHNPIMAYLIGRRRTRLLQAVPDAAFWVALLAADVYFFNATFASRDALVFLYFGIFQLIILPSLVGINSAIVTAVHIRRVLDRVPFAELMLTRLSPSEIAHGLAIQPLATQSSFLTLATVVHCALALGTITSAVNSPAPEVIVFMLVCYASVGGCYRWYLCSCANEIAVSFALRAHLMLRQPRLANTRMLLDWLRMPVVTLIILLPSLIDLNFVVVSGFLILILSPLTLMHHRAEEVMDWISRFHHEWWVLNEGDELSEESLGRALVGPWRPRFRPGYMGRRAADP